MNKLFQKILEPYRPNFPVVPVLAEPSKALGADPGNTTHTRDDSRESNTHSGCSVDNAQGLASSAPCLQGDSRRRGNTLSGGVESRHADSGSSTSAHNITGPKDDVASEGSVSPAQNTYANCPYKHVPERGNVYCTIKDCGVNKGWGTCLWENTLSGGEVSASGNAPNLTKARSVSTLPLSQPVLRSSESEARWPSIAEQEAYWMRKEEEQFGPGNPADYGDGSP